MKGFVKNPFSNIQVFVIIARVFILFRKQMLLETHVFTKPRHVTRQMRSEIPGTRNKQGKTKAY